MSDPTPPRHETAEHASLRTYVMVAVILSLITAMEFAAVYIRELTPVLVPFLLIMSIAKFALVVLFFMHLRYDSRALSLIFAGALAIGIGIALALMTLTGQFLVFRR